MSLETRVRKALDGYNWFNVDVGAKRSMDFMLGSLNMRLMRSNLGKWRKRV